jgi:glycosyltransferase involved in cell wall biosynthesis
VSDKSGVAAADPLISVIMPCHNAAHFVEEAIASVMDQTYRNVELVIVDDGSTDGSTEVIRRLGAENARRISLHTHPRMGPYRARNLGLRHAQGRRIAFLDADDYWSPEALERLSSAMDASDANVAYCGWRNVGANARCTEPFIPPDYLEMDTAAEFLRSCPWPIHAALVKREAIDAVCGFSERCMSSMDYDLWLRLYAHSQHLVRVPEVLAFYRWHGQGQISGSKWKQVVDAQQVRRDFVANHAEHVAHLPATVVQDLTAGFLLREAYGAFWKRDLVDAQQLFRRAFVQRLWRPRDLRYILPALLPASAFVWLIRRADHMKKDGIA